MKITRIPRKKDLHKKRVATYCRMSTLLENQEDSFKMQVSYAEHQLWNSGGTYLEAAVEQFVIVFACNGRNPATGVF